MLVLKHKKSGRVIRINERKILWFYGLMGLVSGGILIASIRPYLYLCLVIHEVFLK